MPEVEENEAAARVGSHQQLREGGLVGRGRSGEVYLARDAHGRPMVRKVFGGEGAGLGKLVMVLLYGAPNPYRWCEAAIRASACRRRILEKLVRYWFDGTLRLPTTQGTSWNAEQQAFELHSEFIRGSHAPLRYHPPLGALEPIEHLCTHVMRPLQDHLKEAGLDGLVWQAGLGNPVAANNFMLESAVADPQRRWVWIDLESGVPALFPINPLALLGYYVPCAWKFRRPMFDDVDVLRLSDYLEAHGPLMQRILGAEAVEQLLSDVDDLSSYERQWRSIRRPHRSIAYELSRQRITESEAEYFRKNTARWYARLAGRAAVHAKNKAYRGIVKAWRCLGAVRWAAWGRSTVKFCFSQRFRSRIAHRIVSRRIGVWELRGYLPRDTAKRLRTELRNDTVSEYLTDFGMHIVLKPVDWLVVSTLLGFREVVWAGVVLLSGGVVVRTAYTLGRTIQAAARLQPLPWVALLVGVMPVIGNAAYPAQLLYSGEKGLGLPRFILYDVMATLGRNLPIWGGADSLTEHFMNRMPDVFRRRK